MKEARPREEYILYESTYKIQSNLEKQKADPWLSQNGAGCWWGGL